MDAHEHGVLAKFDNELWTSESFCDHPLLVRVRR
jgi:hypothetical protein